MRIESPDNCLLRETTPITVTLCVLLDNSEWIFGTYKLNVLTWLELLLLCMIFLPVLIFRIFFSLTLSSLLNYRFLYCIQLYTWSTQQVIVAQHMRWLLKASNPPMFRPINYFSFKGRWFPFSFHIWSTIPDFSISPRTISFRCSSSLTFSGRPISPWYILPQLQGME